MLERLESRITAPEAPPRLVDLAEAVFQERSAFTGALVEHRYGELQTQEETSCPVCARRLAVHEVRPRTAEALAGAVTLRRPCFCCADCEHDFSPRDEAPRSVAVGEAVGRATCGGHAGPGDAPPTGRDAAV